MRKNLFLALAIVAPLAAAAPALAFDTSGNYSVNFEGQKVGSWTLRNRVVDTGSSCQYTIEWHDNSGPPLTRTTLCKINETKASDNFDCEENRSSCFNTLIQKSGTCKGFDEFGGQTTIDTLVGGETDGCEIDGVVVSDSIGDVETLQVR